TSNLNDCDSGSCAFESSNEKRSISREGALMLKVCSGSSVSVKLKNSFGAWLVSVLALGSEVLTGNSCTGQSSSSSKTKRPSRLKFSRLISSREDLWVNGDCCGAAADISSVSLKLIFSETPECLW